MLRRFAFLAVLAVLAAVAAADARAQSEGGAADGGTAVGPGTGLAIVSDPGTDVISSGGGGPAEYRSYAEDMRLFILHIADFARSHNPDFGVVAENGLDLAEKQDPIDEYLSAPARAFMRAVDAVLVTGMKMGFPEEEAEEDAEGELVIIDDDGKSERVRRLNMMLKEGVRALFFDVTEDAEIIRAGRTQARREYNSPFYGAPDEMERLSRLTRTPRRPFDENPDSVLTLDAVRNFAVLTNSAPLGRMDEFALKMQASNYDLLIVSPFHGRQPLSRRAVDTLRWKKNGARRLVYARINVGYAPRFAYYWEKNWREGSPRFIGPPVRDDPDLYRAVYWSSGWRDVFAGGNQSYIYGLIAQGYDGVVLSGLDAHYFFEAGGVEE